MISRKKCQPQDKILLVLLVAINIAVFIAACQTPILWQHSERALDHFYWSSGLTNGEFNILRTGFEPGDFWKIFFPFRLDGGLRTRQAATALELTVFKVMQFFNWVGFKDILLIAIHVLNVGLLAGVVFRITRSPLAASAGAMLLLNSGITLSTVLFPFRIMKILIVTFFLVLWLQLLMTSIPFKDWPKVRRFLYYLVIALALFSDETFILCLPVLALIMINRDGFKQTFSKQLLREYAGLLLVYLGTLYLAVSICMGFDQGADLIVHQKGLENWGRLYSTTPFLKESLLAFFAFFLRRSLGYWDTTLGGALSCGAAFLLLAGSFFYRKTFRLPNRHLFLIQVLLGFIIVKLFLLPHPFGHHEFIMPKDCAFPSLLFFSYYYPYIDAVFFLIILSVLLSSSFLLSKGKYFVVLSVCLISFSNYQHIHEGLKDTLRFHDRYFSHQDAVPKIKKIKPLLTLTDQGPLYLSFPSGSQKIYPRLMKPSLMSIDPVAFQYGLAKEFYNYCLLIPPQFLRRIEQGKIIISLNNIKAVADHDNRELEQARYFYDVHQPFLLDLRKLRPLTDGQQSPFSPKKVDRKAVARFITNDSPQEIVFFVKGAAEIILESKERIVERRQDYGESYQIFRFGQRDMAEIGNIFNVRIRALIPGRKIYWVGPFTLAARR